MLSFSWLAKLCDEYFDGTLPYYVTRALSRWALSEFEYPSSGAILTALAISFLFSFSIFLHFLLPFLQSDVPRMAKTAGDSLAALLAQKPKLPRSAVEAQPKLRRTLGAPFELARSGSGFSWSLAATACGLSCAKASKQILFLLFCFRFLFVNFLVRSVCSLQSCRALQSLQVLRKFRGDNKSATRAAKGKEEAEGGGEGVEKVRTPIADCALILCVCVCVFVYVLVRFAFRLDTYLPWLLLLPALSCRCCCCRCCCCCL